ncbi:MAG: hypothetical protein ACRED1_05210, partial [Limisphaerales bacterium]
LFHSALLRVSSGQVLAGGRIAAAGEPDLNGILLIRKPRRSWAARGGTQVFGAFLLPLCKLNHGDSQKRAHHDDD